MTNPPTTSIPPIHIVGAGLAGSEAAWQVASLGVRVVLHEMRPHRMTEAHRTDGLAELVCSNSFRSDDAAGNAVGLLHAEMRRLGSLIMRAADANQVPAGGALAVDRDGFSSAVTRALHEHPLIDVQRREIDGLPPPDWQNVIVATGPLTSAPAGGGDLHADRRKRAGVLRRDRPDRAPGFDRHVQGLVSVPL